MWLLKQNTTRKKQVDKNATKLNTGKDSIKYKIKAIWDSADYTKESKSGYLAKVYHLVFWKKYWKEKNICKPYSAIQYLKKFINLFYKNYSNKLMATFKAINTTTLIARAIIKSTAQKKKPG